MIAHKRLPFIQPTQPASPAPVVDHITRRMCAAFRKAKRSDYFYMGEHECCCGAVSTAYDYSLPNNQLTNSLCIHYLAHHRSEVPAHQLEAVEALTHGELEPTWAELQGPELVRQQQAAAEAVRAPKAAVHHEWRYLPQLRGRLHPDYPDDIQVLVHDGGPRFTGRRPELVWARIVAAAPGVFTAEVLNQPRQLRSVHQGDRIQFVVPDSGDHPVMVRDKYLTERAAWIVHPCNGCGLSELFDAPSDLIPKVFPNMRPGDTVEGFTVICGACHGVQVVEAASREGLTES